MNRDCRRNTNVLGVGDGTCDYGTICTIGVGDGQGNKSCYMPREPIYIEPEYRKPRYIEPNDRKLIEPGYRKSRDIESFNGNNNIEGVNVTLWVNVVLIVLILIIIYKVYISRI
jgi:hypothetical protein